MNIHCGVNSADCNLLSVLETKKKKFFFAAFKFFLEISRFLKNFFGKNCQKILQKIFHATTLKKIHQKTAIFY
jgi:hypothetical protein